MPKYYNTTIRSLSYRLRSFADSIPALLEGIVKDSEPFIISAVANHQLYLRGINGKGVKIASYRPYRPSTIKYKKGRSQVYNRVTLRDTGKFYKTMYIVYEPDGFYITSESKVTPLLLKKYGPEVLRLTDKNLTNILRVHIRKEFVKRLKQVAQK